AGGREGGGGGHQTSGPKTPPSSPVEPPTGPSAQALAAPETQRASAPDAGGKIAGNAPSSWHGGPGEPCKGANPVSRGLDSRNITVPATVNITPGASDHARPVTRVRSPAVLHLACP